MKLSHLLFRLSLPFRPKRTYKASFGKKRIEVLHQDDDRIVFQIDGWIQIEKRFEEFAEMVQTGALEANFDILIHKIAVSLNQAGIDIHKPDHVKKFVESHIYPH